MNSIVKIEPPFIKKKEIAQCKRCQRYGHTQKYCNHDHRCVKCADIIHPTDRFDLIGCSLVDNSQQADNKKTVRKIANRR